MQEKIKLFLKNIFLLLIILNICLLGLKGATKCKRTIENPQMVDPSKENEKIWKDRLSDVKEALKNIEKKIKDPESVINKRILSDCIKNALNNLYNPEIDDIENCDQIKNEETDPLKITVTVSDDMHPDDKQHNPNTPRIYAEVIKKLNVQPQGKSLSYSENTYSGVNSAELRIYNTVFTNPNYADCLEGLLFHEVLHLSCFTNKKNDLGEKVTYGCSHKVYPCAPHIHADTGDDYSNKCTEKNCQDEKRGRDTYYEGSANYVADTPDDHYSAADAVVKEPEFETDFLIYMNGSYSYMDNLIAGIYFNGAESPGKLLEVSKVMVIPTNGLMSTENNSTFREIIKEYVSEGGTLLIFSQQYGNQIDQLGLIPDGESLKSYGYREDQSCLKNSVYFDPQSMHPVLSSFNKDLVDVGVDGYFPVYPANANVLLRRKINQEPALLYYHYGQGTVILTSLFSDYAASRSMASTAEIKLVRDLITFAKNPHLPIPMFDLEQNPTPGINLNVQVINNTENQAVKARLIAYTPERDTVLYQTEAAVSLNQGESAEIPVTFTLPELLPTHYGICHMDYELYDADNNLIQWCTESDTGRFSVYKMITPGTIDDRLFQWITVKDEIAYWGQEVECTIHLKNTTTQTKTIEAKNPFFYIDHGSEIISFNSFSVTLNPGETFEHTAYLPTGNFDENFNKKFTFRIQYYDTEGVLKQIGYAKTVLLKKALTQSSLKVNSSNVIAPGGTLNYTVNSRSDADLSGEYSIKVTLEKYDKESSAYIEIKTIFQGTHDFVTNSDFQQTANYTPETVHPYGTYRLKLEVEGSI